MDSDLSTEHKKQILEDMKEEMLAQQGNPETGDLSDGSDSDDGAPIKILQKDGGDTGTSHHDYDQEVSDLDEGIRNWQDMQETIADDLNADDERIRNDDSLSDSEKQDLLSKNEQKRQDLREQYDREYNDLMEERNTLVSKAEAQAREKDDLESPSDSMRRAADMTEPNEVNDADARAVLEPRDDAFRAEEGENPLTSDPENINRQELADYQQSDVNDEPAFSKDSKMGSNNRICDIEMQDGLKMEDFSKEEFDELRKNNPMAANKLETEYLDRTNPAVDVNAFPKTENGREFSLADSKYAITDEQCTNDCANMKDLENGKEYTVYPNPLSRNSAYDIHQGNNDVGIKQDCGLASSSEAINGLYGKKISCETKNVDLATKMDNYELAFKPLRDENGDVLRDADGSPLLSDEIDWPNSGGTMESNVQKMFDAYNISSDTFTDDRIPDANSIAEALKNGDNVVAAVNSDLFWNQDDPRTASDFYQKMDPQDVARWKQGYCSSDHFVNVYGACYDSKSNELSGFLVKDTGNGRDSMVPLSQFNRAYRGDAMFTVQNRGCVIAHARGGNK